MPEEKINHPAHYNQLPHEVIEIVADRVSVLGTL